MDAKRYDRRYFDRWYRGRRPVRRPADLERKAALALAVSDWALGRPARTVLDVGCGEGAWRGALLKLRPRLSWLGVDASDYAVARFGARRRILLSSFGGLGRLDLKGPYDLVIASDVLHYLSTVELTAGLPALASLTGGVAWLDLFASEDAPTGDLRGWHARRAAWWRAAFRRARLVECGLGFWARAEVADGLPALHSGVRSRILNSRF